MNDDSIVRVMQSLGLDYNPAINSTLRFEKAIGKLNTQLFQLKANALKGAKDINNIFSSQLGQFTGTKTIVDQFGQPLKTIQSEIPKGFKTATTAAKEHSKSVQDLTKSYNILGSEFQRRAGWFLTGTMFYGTIKAAKETVQTISEVEMGMIEIARIMDDSTFVFKEYRDELLQLGVDYGQTFDVVQDIAVKWAQAGYNAADTLELTKTALLALNTAELDATYATQGLIAIMAQWNLTSQELLPILDKINKTADDFSITTQDIIDGLNRSGAAAKNMNMSLEETIGVITTLREASGRTGKEVGNALNTIISYIQRGSSINVMEKMGIKVFADEAKTQFVNVLELFEQISQKWKDPTVSAALKQQFEEVANEAGLFNEELAVAVGLQEEYNDLQKRDLAQSAAGVRRRNYFISLMERFARVQEVVNNMMDAGGYSMRENARTMEGLEKKYNSLKASAQQLAVALGDAGLLDLLKGLVDGTKDVVSSFTEMDEGLKALVVTALELLAVLGTLKATIGLFTTKNLFIGAGSIFATIPVWGQVAAAIAAVTGAVMLLTHNLEKASAQSVEDSAKIVNARNNEIDKTNALIEKYEELRRDERYSSEIKQELLEIQRELAEIYPEYVDGLDDEGNKLVTNIPLIREMNSLKQQQLEIERQRLIMEANTQLPMLEAEAKRLQDEIDRNSKRLESGDVYKEFRRGGQTYKIDETKRIQEDNLELIENLIKTKSEISRYKAALDSLNNPPSPSPIVTPLPSGDDDGNGDKSKNSSSGHTGQNKALQEALRLLEHKKRMNQISLAEEIQQLNQIKALYARTANERMDLDEKIFDAEKRLNDERMKLAQEAYDFKESRIQHWARMGTYSIQQQIDMYRELYSIKKLTTQEQWKLDEQIFGLYKKALGEQQQAIREAYDERIEQIEAEAKAKKSAQEEIIEEIEKELRLLDKQESKYNYEKKMDDLKKELEYWSVRTSEEARKRVAELTEEIAEAEHDREVELKRQSFENKKRIAQDEIKAIDEAAKTEKENWEKSYKLVEDAFDDHSTNIVALASTMSKEAFWQWQYNYIIPLQNALINANLGSFDSISNNMNDFINETGNSQSKNAQIYNAAKAIVGLKKQYEIDGDLSAAQRAIEYYNKLERLKPSVAQQLHQMNYETAKEYIKNLPKAHTGGLTLSYGAVYMKPGELIFPPDLSEKLESLISVLYSKPIQQTSSLTDNRKSITIDKLLNIERNYIEDELDSDILSRDLQRALLAIF